MQFSEWYVSISRRGSFTGLERLGRVVIQPPPCSTVVHVWRCTSAPPVCLREVLRDIFNPDLYNLPYPQICISFRTGMEV